jgi:hypothetical protein
MKKLFIILLILLVSPLFATRYDFDIVKNGKTYEVILFRTSARYLDSFVEEDLKEVTAYQEAAAWRKDYRAKEHKDYIVYNGDKVLKMFFRGAADETLNLDDLHTVVAVFYRLNGYLIPDNFIVWEKNRGHEFARFRDASVPAFPEFFIYRQEFYIREKGTNNNWVNYWATLQYTDVKLDPEQQPTNLTYLSNLFWGRWACQETDQIESPHFWD